MFDPATTQKKSTGLWVALGLMALGFGATALNWYMALHDGRYYPSAALVTPFVGSLGLAMLVAPEPEKAADGSVLPYNAYRSLRRNLARGIAAFGLVGSVANFGLISGWVHF